MLSHVPLGVHPSTEIDRKWPRSLFPPVQARSWKERSGPGWDQDGPGWPPPRDLDGSEMLRSRRPATGVPRALRARSVPGVSPRVSPKMGGCARECPTRCSQGPSGPGLRSVQKVSRECPVEQSTWRIWTGPLRTRDGAWTGPASDPGEGLDGTPSDSHRLLGLPESMTRFWGRLGGRN